MIVGIGNDILEMKRMERACSKESFLVRCFTDRELEAANGRMSFFGGNFCVKEAVAKAFGTGFRNFSPRDIEVLRDELGKPYVVLHEGAELVAKKLGVTKVHVSISNLKELVSAVAVAEGD